MTTVRRQAFTLIELLTVIVIISLLAAMLMPALGKARASARRVACRANLHGTGLAFRMYLDDNRDIMPLAAQTPSIEIDKPSIAQALSGCLDNLEVLCCPADKNNKYFKREGSSYEYQAMLLAGKQVDKTFLGKKWGQSGAPVMNDYSTFHDDPGKPGSMNFLFADGHVGILGN